MGEAKKLKKSATRHIVDVEEPGTSAPSSTSKPVIVTNRPLLKDPMVKEEKKNDISEQSDSIPAPALASSSNKSRLQPLVDSISPDDESLAVEPKTPQVSEAAEPETTTSTPESEPEQKASGSEASEADAPQSQMLDDAQADDKLKSTAAKQAEVEAAEQVKHDAAVQKLVDTKRYELPINTVEERQSRKFIMLGIVLMAVLILVWLDIALDAGIIKLGGLHSATHFFSN
jgi:cobalamin biosynthesis Mg chelatase CobN